MRTLHAKRSRGFVLIEALVALLIVSLGALAMAKLESLTISAAGEARSRSEAVTLAQKKLEELRNWVVYSAFTTGMVDGSSTYNGSNATYSYTWTISGSAGGSLVQLTTSWTDRFGNNQSLDLNSLVSFDDPYNQLKGEAGFTGISAPSPSGQAKRGDGSLRVDTDGTTPLGSPTNDGSGTGTRIYDNNGITELLDATGKVVLYLSPVNNVSQEFTTITGRVYFDQNAGNNALPDPENVRVRLSSEGLCFYNNATTNANGATANTDLTTPITAGSNSYTFFTYVCYVGPEWWGNVGVVVDDSVNGQGANPTVCVGDPDFNTGVSDGTLISANPVEASVRSYRGFFNNLTTGMEGGSTYPFYEGDPNDTSDDVAYGLPKPASYSSYYPSANANSPSTNYFNHHFLLTSISGQGSCYAKMQGGEFTQNAGKYFCISPDDDPNTDTCPSTWPGFTVGSGGQLNYLLSVSKAGSGTGTVTSSPAGISCDAGCITTQNASYASGTSVTLTAAPASGSTFAGWSGACSGTGSCTVTMTQTRDVVATFNTGATSYALDVTVSGTGTVTSSTGGISCPGTCTGSYSSGDSVTLTATAPSGSDSFMWGGACSGSGTTCTVTMDAAKSVTATYYLPVPYTLSLSKSAGGSVTSLPVGISCDANCTTTSSSYASGTAVTLSVSTASGYEFAGWGGACANAGTSTTCTVTMTGDQTVSASFNAYCPANITGTAHDKFGSVTLITPSGGGSCAMDGGNSSGYSCTVTAVNGGTVVLKNYRNTGSSSDQYCYTINIPWTCNNISNGYFPGTGATSNCTP